ncbi:MAG: serine/threonine protein kinase [Candidatus Abyssobacteria bacterium SURF_17]|uniref:Serine/threonine protein kinase n=1 Tax=Candidatus Abyssobacteria bacterium SURF_17 TaxID=2093361 RepID=A0A419F0H0_9BACT|nr:MAG: serine/threonine protein kinase [Candidatus Abyssubacteria bacterium SURF_17]
MPVYSSARFTTIPERFGKMTRDYELCEQIGESHSSKVYRAIHKPTSKVVAIKVIPPKSLEKLGGSRGRYEEPEFHCPLKHKNILQCYDFFTDGERGYLVTEYVNGFNLRHCIEESAKSFPDAHIRINHLMDTAQRICEGLIYLHDQKIVHGQIKPENILVSGDTVGPFFPVHREVKISDFALAGLVKGFLHPAARVKGGDIRYMSPEQMIKKRTTFRSDIFSLGVTLYELFTGHSPWDGRSGKSDLLARALSPKFRPPLPSNLIASLPGQLDSVIMKMVEKNERHRPANMVEVWLALGKLGALKI